MPLELMALVTVIMHMVSAQERGSNVLRQGESQDVQSEIATSRTRAFLSCESGEMVVRVNFSEPFRGLMYAHKIRLSPCRVNGFGGLYYELRIPLKGCGTWQESPRVFVNNVTIRFHRALELEEDETKTVVCRYPPPLTPPPGGIIHIVSPPVTPSPNTRTVRTAALSEVEILIIICLLLFLSLLTLGIGIAYFCLKRRNIHIVRTKRKTTSSMGPSSQLTKLSSSAGAPTSLTASTILDHTVRIPRAVPYSASLRTTSGGHMAGSDPDYYEHPSTTPTSRDSLESTPSSSTTSNESIGGTRQLLHYKGGPTSTLSIPKAILRKDDITRHTLASVHRFFSSRATSSFARNRLGGEVEDQTVTTVLEPESGNDDNNYWDFTENRISEMTSYDVKTFPRSAPVYAQVEKKKHRVRILEGAQVMKPDDKSSRHDIDGVQYNKLRSLSPVPGMAKREVIKKEPMLLKKVEEVNSNTTTSVLRTSTRPILHTKPDKSKIESLAEDVAYQNNDSDQLGLSETGFFGQKESRHISPGSTRYSDLASSLLSETSPLPVLEGRNLCIKDIDDIYITTTVQTESTELRTVISRDTVEEHVKDKVKEHIKDKVKEHSNDGNKLHATIKDHVDSIVEATDISNESDVSASGTDRPSINNLTKPASKCVPLLIPLGTNDYDRNSSVSSIDDLEDKEKMASLTDNWNVIIRQRKPPSSTSSLSDVNNTSDKDSEDETSKSSILPKFDVVIRSFPPKQQKDGLLEDIFDRKQSTELVNIPNLQMPQTIEKIRDIMTKLEQVSKEPQKAELVKGTGEITAEDTTTSEVDKVPKATNVQAAKTVWWSKDSAPIATTRTTENSSTLSSSESFQSEDSLRERSSSEVLEKVPTLFSRRDSYHPMLERSTSEIVTSPDEHVRWTESTAISESFSPEFLANIPVVTQGGFFHGNSSLDVARKPSKETMSSET